LTSNERLERRQQSHQQGKLKSSDISDDIVVTIAQKIDSQAHALSAKASQTAQISATADNLSKAAELYSEAADLFEQVKKDASDSGVRIYP
jgi:hypothetical protein